MNVEIEDSRTVAAVMEELQAPNVFGAHTLRLGSPRMECGRLYIKVLNQQDKSVEVWRTPFGQWTFDGAGSFAFPSAFYAGAVALMQVRS